MRLIAAALLVALACIAPHAVARGGVGSHSATTSTHSTSGSHSRGFHSTASLHGSSSRAAASSHSGSSHSGKGSHSKAVPGVHRDSHGKIARDPRQTNAFKKQHPCPSTGNTSGSCPGYVIDHVIPLKRGGADSPGNMQWQTEGAAKLKDKWE
jgi:hypothetical protein